MHCRERRPAAQIVACLLVVLLLVVACMPAVPRLAIEVSLLGRQVTGFASTGSRPVAEGRVRTMLGPVPFPIETNVGQAPDDIAYLLRAGALQVGFARGGPRVRLMDGAPNAAPECHEATSRRKKPATPDAEDCPMVAHTLAIELVGARDADPFGSVPSETLMSWFRGQPDEWKVGIPAFDQVIYPNAWPGIDVLYERAPGVTGFKSGYVVAPGTELSSIRLAWHGADTAMIDEQGALVLATPVGPIRESAPVAWQDSRDGGRDQVSVHLVILTDGRDERPVEVAFAVSDYDSSRPLIIDPVVQYGGYIGGSQADQVMGIAVDGNGAAYVVGYTNSSISQGFPAFGGPSASHGGGSDAFIAKVKPDGTGLTYAGFIGGTQSDSGSGIAVDTFGAAYITGNTASSLAQGFPASVGPATNYVGPGSNGFVAKLTPNGSGIIYAGYIAGCAPIGIGIDSANAAYIAGVSAYDPDGVFPAVIGPSIAYGGNFDVCVAKISPDGSALMYAGYIGGSGGDTPYGMTLDDSGALYVVGQTDGNFPTVVGPGAVYGGSLYDAFVAKVKPDGTGFDYAGYIGGTKFDRARAVVVDSSGAAIVTGFTDSPATSNFPITSPPGTNYDGGYEDAFLAKIGPNGSRIEYLRYLAVPESTIFWGMVLPQDDIVFMTDGYNPAKVKTIDAEVIEYSELPQFSGETRRIAVDRAGAVYLAGDATAGNFPTVVGPGVTYGGRTDAVIRKLVTPTPTATATQTSTPTMTPIPTSTSTPTVSYTPTHTITPSATPGICHPRPTVTVSTVRPSYGLLSSTVIAGTLPATPSNWLRRIRFTQLDNASVAIRGLANQKQPFVIELPERPRQVNLTATGVTPGPFTVRMVVEDDCGSWPTFVGAGASAF